MPTDPDRAYAKKHKINDLLNELYLELTKNKPENPVEFAIKHLETKLPPKEQSQLSFKISLFESEPTKDLFKTLINQTNNKIGTDTKFVSPISTFNILNRINQSIVKANKELTNEELLEKENIVYQSKNDEESTEQPANVAIKYKNYLKSRKLVDQHREDIKRLVESELYADKDDYENKTLKQKSEQYSEELMHEIITADNPYHLEEKKPKKKQQKLRPVKSNADLAAPLIKLIVCQFCSKLQNKLDEKNAKDSLIKEDEAEGGVKNEENIFDFFPRASVAREENLDDEIIESASQVSGPRKIEPYEAQTSRVDKQENADNGNQNILAWVLKNKLKSEIKEVDLKSESTLVGSKAARNEASPKPAQRQPSAASVRKKSNGSVSSARSENNDSSRQQWRINSHSSNSDLSGLRK